MFLTDPTLTLLIESGLPGDKLAQIIRAIEADLAAVAPVKEDPVQRRRRLDRERKRRVRESAENSAGGADESGQDAENADGERTEADNSAKRKGPEPQKKNTPLSPLKGTVPPTEVREAADLWNALAERLGLPKAVSVNETRKKAIKARLREHGLPGWKRALAAVERSRFCRGQTDKGFRADLDFVCQQKSFTRLIEGFYGDDAKAAAPVPAMIPEWTGPAEFRADVLADHGEGFVRAYLDPAGWANGSERLVLARNGIAADRLAKDCRGLLSKHGLGVRCGR